MKRHLFRNIVLIALPLVAAIAALCIWRWNILFGATTERVYELDGWPHAAVMTAGQNGVSDRSFSWRTAGPDTCEFLLHKPDGTTDTIPSIPDKVLTMGGEQYRHVIRLTDLSAGEYAYTIRCRDRRPLEGIPFLIAASDTLRFCCFGDLLLTDDTDASTVASNALDAHSGAPNPATMAERICATEGYPFDAVLYTGNIVRASTHQCWAGWYRSMQRLQAGVPQLGVPGSRDYEHGVHRDLDPRWPWRFPMPLNGPERFLGTTYYIDYPQCRLVFLDTEVLERLSDYTVLQCWVRRVMQDAGDKWKIVVMHHPVHSASAGFDHPRLYTYLHQVLDEADLIFSGNDLTYGRRAEISLSDIIREQRTVPVYVCLTSDSTEAAVPKCSPLSQRIGSNRAFYCTIELTADTLDVRTRYMNYPDSIYDAFRVGHTDKVVLVSDSLPDEVIELPARHADGGIRARRFEHLRDARIRRTTE